MPPFNLVTNWESEIFRVKDWQLLRPRGIAYGVQPGILWQENHWECDSVLGKSAQLFKVKKSGLAGLAILSRL